MTPFTGDWPARGWVMRKPTLMPTSATSRLSRITQLWAGLSNFLRNSSTAITRLVLNSTMASRPMAPNSAESSGVSKLKWLRFPLTTCVTMIVISATPATANTVPSHHAILRRRPSSRLVNHAREAL